MAMQVAPGRGELRGVLHEVLEASSRAPVRPHDRKVGSISDHVAPARAGEADRLPGEIAEGHVLRRVDDPPHPRQLEEVVEEPVHLVRRRHDAAEVQPDAVELAGREVGGGQPREAVDGHERALEVVGHGVGEALELGVLRREIGSLRPQRLLVRPEVAGHPVERSREVAELVGGVEGEGMIEVPGRDLGGGPAHLGERRARLRDRRR
jgi:hypothetical protein